VDSKWLDGPLLSIVKCSGLAVQVNENRSFRLFVSNEKEHSEGEARVCLKVQEEGERYANQH
jgi:hypothetical protein